MIDVQGRKASSSELVPGDVLALDVHSVILPCDGVLISGDVIVDESMLTGESIAMTKIPIAGELGYRSLSHFCSASESRHVLYSGTRIIKCRSDLKNTKPRIVVTRTGFRTSKGKLVRSIMFQPPNTFKFYLDAFKFVGLTGILAAIGFVYTVVNFLQLHAPIGNIIIHALDLVTTVSVRLVCSDSMLRWFLPPFLLRSLLV